MAERAGICTLVCWFADIGLATAILRAQMSDCGAFQWKRQVPKIMALPDRLNVRPTARCSAGEPMAETRQVTSLQVGIR